MSDQKTYADRARCPAGHKFIVFRRVGTAGKTVRTYCRMCERAYQIKAGTPKEPTTAPTPPSAPPETK